MNYLILGCGYTGKRVAELLVSDGEAVICTNRQAGSLPGARCVSLDVSQVASLDELVHGLDDGMTVLHSIPPAGEREYSGPLLDALRKRQPRRVVYLSTTGVYGAAETVDADTAAAPDTVRDEWRFAAEEAVLAGPWTALVLRPAAIYGPGRGVHTSIKKGLFRMPDAGGRMVSRIHVDDLANIAVAALRSELAGVYPVADQEPAASIDVVKFAAQAVGLPMPRMSESPSPGRSRGRRVDGRAILAKLQLSLHYPTYREGTLACLKAEGADDSEPV